MASIRRLNALGQMRVDVPHLRMIESGVAHDFDVLAGKMMAGERPLVISGLTVLTTGMIGAAATNLNVAVAGALILHYGATDNGTIFEISSDQAQEQLEPGNARLVGSWVASAVNYVGLDLQMSADATTSDSVKFLDPDTDTEINRTVALGRTLDYKFVLSTMPFSSRSTILPLAKVTLDNTGAITAIVDAREMMFRLGSGGDSPDQAPFSWPEAREEEYGGDVFAGGDKGISDLKSWADAVMTRIWEQGGGPAWYSATADRNVTMVWTGATFTNGENFEWDGTNLHWKGLKFLFDNTPGWYNDVVNVTVDTPGTTNLADGECLYVDLNRNTSGATLTAAKAVLSTLGPGTVPGARWILAWRSGANIYTRNWRYAVGTTFTPATTTSLGVVQLNQTPASAGNPKVVSIMTDGRIEVTATAGNTDAATFTSFGYGAGVVGRSTLGSGGVFSQTNAGVVGYGANGAAGGSVHRQFGRPGITGIGGSGIIGGSGGYSFGGPGDPVINANSSGGVGHFSQGGAGVGVGLGAEAYQGVGGLDGTGTIRQPGFVAPIPSTGPLPTLAFQSLAGGAEIPVANTYRFGAAKTGFILIDAAEFTGFAFPSAPAFSGAYGGVPFNVWVGAVGAASGLSASAKLPRGAVITSIRILFINNSAGGLSPVVDINKKSYAAGSPFLTPTAVATAFTPVVAPVGGWTNITIAPSITMGNGATLSSDVTTLEIRVTMPSVASLPDFAMGGVIIEYAYRTVDFMV
jgi:hypothetical protein